MNTNNKIVQLSDLFTRSRANEGMDLPVLFPDKSDTGYTIHILGIDSDQWRKGRATHAKALVDISLLPEEAQEEAKREAEIVLLAGMITGWTLPGEFTRENVITLLREAPDIYDQVNVGIAHRSAFFEKR